MEQDERACPLCAETVKAEAIRCKHCHGDISSGALSEEPSSVGVGAIQKVLIVLVLGVVAIFAIGALSRPSPEDQAIDQGRRAVQMCHDNESSYKGPAGGLQIISGACRKLEADFTTRFGRKP